MVLQHFWTLCELELGSVTLKDTVASSCYCPSPFICTNILNLWPQPLFYSSIQKIPKIYSTPGTITALVFVSAGAHSDSDETTSACAPVLPGGIRSELSGTFFKVRQAGILDCSVRRTALHSVRLPQKYDSSFELWAPCVNKDVQHFQAAAAAGRASAKVSIMLQKEKGGHCTLLKVTALPKMGPLQSWN